MVLVILLRIFLVSFVLINSDITPAQASDDPNLLMLDAIQLYEDSIEASGFERQSLLKKVARILNRIEREHPSSIPAIFMEQGIPLGTIDMHVLSEALPDLDTELPETTHKAIQSVAARACVAIHCGEELEKALVAYFLELFFTDIDNTAEIAGAIDLEKLRGLFSNPGQLDGNLERVIVFDQLIENPDFIDNLDRRLAERVHSDILVAFAENIAKEAAMEFAIKLVTNVATELIANSLTKQGRADEAGVARRWVEASVDISLPTQRAALTPATTGDSVIWAKNAYSFVQLGQKSIAAQESGTTNEQKIAKIGEAIYSLDASLRNGVVSGPMFDDEYQGKVMTERMFEAFRQTLKQNYELQRLWLSSDEAIQLEAFYDIVDLAKTAARLVNEIVGVAPAADPGQASGTEAANSTNSLPGNLNFSQRNEAEYQLIELGIPASSSSDREILSPNTRATSNYGTEWHLNIVPKGKVGNGYHHGQFPSWGARTHAGTDIGGGCNLDVLAPMDGDVIEVVTESNSDFGAVGNAVVISHGIVNGLPTYTAYFHLADRPNVSIGPVIAGAKLGKTGRTGAADACHLHFEVRHFKGIRNLYNPDQNWRNIYGNGDQSHSETFLSDWTDPGNWLDRVSSTQDALQTNSPGLLGDSDTPLFSDQGNDEAISLRFADACSRPNDRPETLSCPMVQERMCIGEGCVMAGVVKTNRPMNLVAEAGSTSISYMTKAQELLAIVSSHVVSLPCRAEANGLEGLPDGSVIYLISYRGEGTFHYWRDGRVYLATARDREVRNIDTRCFATQEKMRQWTSTWSLESEWWLELRSHDGSTGWLNVSALDWGGDAGWPLSGVSRFDGEGEIEIPDWAHPFVDPSISNRESQMTEPKAAAARSLPRCSVVGALLSSSEVMLSFSGKIITIVGDDRGIVPLRYRVGPMNEEGQFTSYQTMLAGGFSVEPEKARAMDGKFCVLNNYGEFCSTVEKCASGEAVFVLTPFAGDVSYVQSIETGAGTESKAEITIEGLRQDPEILQSRLRELEYYFGAIDGHPGPQTRQALMKFQAEYCLAPNGQPDLPTAMALIEAAQSAPPCAGARLSVGIEANTPLREGIYVDNPVLCSSESVPFETVHLQQRIVRGTSITWGQEGGCQIRRTDIVDGITLFRGSCLGSNASMESSWRFDVLSNDAFIDLDMPTAMPQDALPRRFTKCPDESFLRTSWAPWFN